MSLVILSRRRGERSVSSHNIQDVTDCFDRLDILIRQDDAEVTIQTGQ